MKANDGQGNHPRIENERYAPIAVCHKYCHRPRQLMLPPLPTLLSAPSNSSHAPSSQKSPREGGVANPKVHSSTNLAARTRKRPAHPQSQPQVNSTGCANLRNPAPPSLVCEQTAHHVLVVCKKPSKRLEGACLRPQEPAKQRPRRRKGPLLQGVSLIPRPSG